VAKLSDEQKATRAAPGARRAQFDQVCLVVAPTRCNFGIASADTAAQQCLWIGWDFGEEHRLSDIHPRCEVAVVATPDGKFTFQIFAVSGEPKTLEIGTERYMTPADAARAGHAMIATKRL
jgi:hypothetical protein